MVTIKNLTRRLVSVRLNSGEALHLPPGTSSPEMVAEEVQSNNEIQKLQDRLIIAIQTADAASRKTAVSEQGEQ